MMSKRRSALRISSRLAPPLCLTPADRHGPHGGGRAARVRQAVLEGVSAVDRLFAVTRIRGPAWDPSMAMEAQADWPAHAMFMNRLHAEEFVLLGGPLDGTPDVLLI